MPSLIVLIMLLVSNLSLKAESLTLQDISSFVDNFDVYNNQGSIASIQETARHRKCEGTIKCHRLYYLKQQASKHKISAFNKHATFNSSQVLQVLYYIQTQSLPITKLTDIVKFLLEQIVVTDVAIYNRLYSMAIWYKQNRDYDSSTALMQLGFNKYKNEVIGYYFLLGLLDLNNLRPDLGYNVCSIDSNNLSFYYLIRFNHDYMYIYHQCPKLAGNLVLV